MVGAATITSGGKTQGGSKSSEVIIPRMNLTNHRQTTPPELLERQGTDAEESAIRSDENPCERELFPSSHLNHRSSSRELAFSQHLIKNEELMTSTHLNDQVEQQDEEEGLVIAHMDVTTKGARVHPSLQSSKSESTPSPPSMMPGVKLEREAGGGGGTHSQSWGRSSSPQRQESLTSATSHQHNVSSKPRPNTGHRPAQAWMKPESPQLSSIKSSNHHDSKLSSNLFQPAFMLSASKPSAGLWNSDCQRPANMLSTRDRTPQSPLILSQIKPQSPLLVGLNPAALKRQTSSLLMSSSNLDSSSKLESAGVYNQQSNPSTPNIWSLGHHKSSTGQDLSGSKPSFSISPPVSTNTIGLARTYI